MWVNNLVLGKVASVSSLGFFLLNCVWMHWSVNQIIGGGPTNGISVAYPEDPCSGQTTTECAEKTEPKDVCTKKKGGRPMDTICTGEIIGDPVATMLTEGEPGNNMKESEEVTLCVWRYKCADNPFPFEDCVRGDAIGRSFTTKNFHGGTCLIPTDINID